MRKKQVLVTSGGTTDVNFRVAENIVIMDLRHQIQPHKKSETLQSHTTAPPAVFEAVAAGVTCFQPGH